MASPPRHTPSQHKTQTSIPLHPDEFILVLAAGGNHTLVLTTQGRVFAAGSNVHGELGLSSPSLSSPSSTDPGSVSTSSPPPSIQAGFHHIPWTGPSFNPASNQVSHHITHIACTFTASIFVSGHTTLYTVGHGPKGELGIGEDVVNAVTPTKAFDIRDLEEDQSARIETVTACVDHVLVLSGQGVIYGFGSARRGKLAGDGLSADGGAIWWSVKRTGMDLGSSGRVRQVVSGREFSVLGSEKGELVVFGRGFEKEIDNGVMSGSISASKREKGQDQKETEDVRIDATANITTNSPNPPTIHAGWTSLTLHNHQTSHLTGALSSSRPTQDRGQRPPPILPKATHLAVGSEHTVALLEDGSMVAWGWGEHGNCGEDVDGRGVVGGGKWNVLWRGGDGEVGKDKVVGVGAGCGSSFFWVEREGEEE